MVLRYLRGAWPLNVGPDLGNLYIPVVKPFQPKPILQNRLRKVRDHLKHVTSLRMVAPSAGITQ